MTSHAPSPRSARLKLLESGVFVTCVPDAFVRALAAVRDADFDPVASAWQARVEHLREWSKEELVAMLRAMRAFAASSVTSNKRVLNVFGV